MNHNASWPCDFEMQVGRWFRQRCVGRWFRQRCRARTCSISWRSQQQVIIVCCKERWSRAQGRPNWWFDICISNRWTPIRQMFRLRWSVPLCKCLPKQRPVKYFEADGGICMIYVLQIEGSWCTQVFGIPQDTSEKSLLDLIVMLYHRNLSCVVRSEFMLCFAQ